MSQMSDALRVLLEKDGYIETHNICEPMCFALTEVEGFTMKPYNAGISEAGTGGDIFLTIKDSQVINQIYKRLSIIPRWVIHKPYGTMNCATTVLEKDDPDRIPQLLGSFYTIWYPDM